MIEVKGPIEINTKAGKIIITISDNGDVTIETFQRKGKAKYFFRDIIHPDGQLKTF